MNSDVVVIGCGAGGFTSAIAVAEMGKSVTIVSERIPSTALFSGASYNLDSEKVDASFEALTFFKKIIDSAGYHLSISENKLPLLTESGGIIETRLFSSISASANLNSLLNKKVLFVGIKQLRNFIPELLLMRLKKFIDTGSAGWNSIMMDFALPYSSHEFTEISLAKALDIKENFENFKNVLLNLKGIQSYDVVLLPPILGIKNYNENYRNLKNSLNTDTGELLSSQPSVNGVRLYNGMEKALRERNLKIIPGRCTAFKGKGKIESISVISDSGNLLEIDGRIFIYAPGRFIGGGISSGREIRESLFGLPLYYNKRELNSYFHSLFTYNINEPQAALYARILVNEKFQPLTENGNILAENLYSAGSIVTENLQEGIIGAVISGYLCARAFV